MIKLDNIVKTIRSKGPVETKAAVDPGNGKTPEEIEKEILENRGAMEAIEAKEAKAKEAKGKEESELLPIHTTKPIIATHMDCPFCGEEKTIRGMSRHIKSIHGVSEVSLEDLNRIERGEIAPDALATEKGATEIFGLSPEIDEKHFSDWNDIKEEDPEDLGDPEKEKGPDNPGPPGDPSCYENPGNPDEKNPEDKKNPRERRRLNLMPPFSPFERRRSRI